MLASVRTVPLLVEASIGVRLRVGIVSIAQVAAEHLALRVIAMPGPERFGLVAALFDSAGDELEGTGGGGGGSDGWMAYRFEFRGRLADDDEPLTVRLTDRDAPGGEPTVAVQLRRAPTSAGPVAYEPVEDPEAAVRADWGRLLPESVRTVGTMVIGAAPDHVLLDEERWAATSLVSVHTPSRDRQMTDIPQTPLHRPAVDDLGRRYTVRSDTASAGSSGATSHHRIVPRIPDDASELRLDGTPIVLRLRSGR